MRFGQAILVSAALATCGAEAQTPAIHIGITGPELAEILAPLGWTAQPAATLERRFLSLRDQNGGRWLNIDLLECDSGHRCAS